MWWEDDDYKNEPPPIPSSEDLSWQQIYCNHEWKATILIISTVYDCEKCGIKKERFDKWRIQNK